MLQNRRNFKSTHKRAISGLAQQRNSLAAEQLVSLDYFVERRAPIEHREEMSGADGPALLDDGLCSFLGRSGYELVAAEREPACWRRRIGGVSAQPFVLGHHALQALGYGLGIEMRLLAGRRHGDAPPQRKIFGPRMKSGGVRCLAVGIKYALDRLR